MRSLKGRVEALERAIPKPPSLEEAIGLRVRERLYARVREGDGAGVRVAQAVYFAEVENPTLQGAELAAAAGVTVEELASLQAIIAEEAAAVLEGDP